MNRTLSRLAVVAGLAIGSLASSVAGAHAADLATASNTTSNVIIDGLDCPTRNGPYGISPQCAHAMSEQSVRDAIHFANLAQTTPSTATTAATGAADATDTTDATEASVPMAN